MQTLQPLYHSCQLGSRMAWSKLQSEDNTLIIDYLHYVFIGLTNACCCTADRHPWVENGLAAIHCSTSLLHTILINKQHDTTTASCLLKLTTRPQTSQHTYVSMVIILVNRDQTGLQDLLQITQNNAARVVLAAKRHSDAKPLLRQLHWLPVRQCIQYKVAVLMRKVRMTGAPSYLSQHLVQHVATHQTW